MSIPKYEQIKRDLIREIRAGNFFPGDKFYSESELKRRYDVSSITAVKALNELTAMGYLYRVQGKGTFLSKAKISANVKFSDIENHPIGSETVTILSITKKQDAAILTELNLGTTESYYEIIRTRSVNQTPFIIQYSYVPCRFITASPKDKNAFTSIYGRIRQDTGIDMFSQKSIETNEIVFPSNPEIITQLNLKPSDPVVKQIKHSYLRDGSIAEYVVLYKHWRYFKTKIEVDD